MPQIELAYEGAKDRITDPFAPPIRRKPSEADKPSLVRRQLAQMRSLPIFKKISRPLSRGKD